MSNKLHTRARVTFCNGYEHDVKGPKEREKNLRKGLKSVEENWNRERDLLTAAVMFEIEDEELPVGLYGWEHPVQLVLEVRPDKQNEWSRLWSGEHDCVHAKAWQLAGCDLTSPDEHGHFADPAECTEQVVLRGDLLVCTKHAESIPANVGRVPGEIRCFCGGFRPTSQTECGEPCSFS